MCVVRRLGLIPVLVGAMATLGCGGPRERPAGIGTMQRSEEPLADMDGGAAAAEAAPGGCEDRDGDGYGTSCRRGPDCDDTDPELTDACYRCASPGTGCACDTPGLRLPCDAVTDTDVPGPDGTCYLGERVCEAGTWSRCRAYNRRAQVIVPPSVCNSCNPDCRDCVVCPSEPEELHGRGTAVALSSVYPPGFCPPGTPRGGLELASVNPPPSSACDPAATRCLVLAPGDRAGPEPVAATARAQAADVYFLFSTSSSMSAELAALQSALTRGSYLPGCSGGVLGAIRCVLPDVWFGVGYHADFPVAPYGKSDCGTSAVPGDVVYRNVRGVTADLSSVQAAIDSLRPHCGGDAPQSQVPALWSLATGRGYPAPFDPYLAAGPACPDSAHAGYPCFRPGAMPLVLMFTDAAFHNGPADTHPYDDAWLFGGAAGITYPTAVTVLGNDNEATAYAIPDDGRSFVAAGTTVGLRDDRDAPCAPRAGAPDAVFRLDVTSTRRVMIDTAGSLLDTSLTVVRSDGVVMGCNGDWTGTSSNLVLTLAPARYFVWVDGADAAGNVYQLRYGVAPDVAPGARTPRFLDAVGALNALGARVGVIGSCGAATGCSTGAELDAAALASATGSLIPHGLPAVYPIPADGTGLAAATVAAATDLLANAPMDVTTVALDNPATTVDERCFVASPSGTAPGTVRLSDPARDEPAAYPVGGCVDPPGAAEDGVPIVARLCVPGTEVRFQAEFKNDCVAQTDEHQAFTLDLVTYGNGRYVLGRQTVSVVVPAAPRYEPAGSFSYDVDGASSCRAGQQVRWGQLQFVAETPADTTVRIEARTAATAAELDAAPAVALGTVPPAASPLAVGASLLAGGRSDRLPHLRVTFHLAPDPEQRRTPRVGGFRVLFDCVDGT